MAAALTLGEILILYDPFVTPPKYKWHCCICPERGWFLRINSQPRFHGLNLPLTAKDHPFLDHDSFLDMSALVSFPLAALPQTPLDKKGMLTSAALATVMAAIRESRTLSQFQKQTILFTWNPP